MKGFVSIPCPDCYTALTCFSIGIGDAGTLVLIGSCAPCKVNAKFTIAISDLLDLADGKPIDFQEVKGKEILAPTNTKYVM